VAAGIKKVAAGSIDPPQEMSTQTEEVDDESSDPTVVETERDSIDVRTFTGLKMSTVKKLFWFSFLLLPINTYLIKHSSIQYLSNIIRKLCYTL